MEKIIFFFQHIQSWQRSALLVGGLVLCWFAEGLFPLIAFSYKKWRHAGLNLFFTLTTVLINFGFAGLIVWGSDYTSRHKIGLLYLFALPHWLFILTGLLILDLISAWLIHWIQHQVRWMWKF